MPLIDVHALHCGYGADEIIHGVDFDAEPGEIVTILGPNGCGKTTFVKAILGYVRVSQGNVYFQSKDLARLDPARRAELGIAYVPQLLNVFKPMTVKENLEMGGFQQTREECRSNIDRLFELFPVLRERKEQRANTLSGGERQLLAMGRAMMTSPPLLFLDEPSAGLSPIRADDIFERIRQIAELGTTVVIVEQDVMRALAISARGYVLVNGKVEFEGPAASIIADDRVRTAYLGGLGAAAPPH
ncbi:MAG: ABC transporter ATP-binding protein [Gammaproteobacteria bacterium]|nr:ABC transporter ATP-binding protein [Gammaproteobacteria bacterium]